jgi:hypothetical protein
MSDDDVFECEAECLKETEKALLVRSRDFDEDTWIPKSQVCDESEVYAEGDSGSLVIKGWLARKNGWL